MQRDGFGGRAFDILLHITVGGIQSIRFWGNGEINNCLRKRQIAFGHADKIDGIASGHAKR